MEGAEIVARICCKVSCMGKKHMFHNRKKDQLMNSMAYADDYKDRYEAANFYIDRMAL